MRVRVWENFVERLPSDVGILSPSDIERLAVWQINGREIKNILNMSVSWCRKKECSLTVDAVENVIMTISSTAKKETNEKHSGMNGTSEEDYVANEFSLLEM